MNKFWKWKNSQTESEIAVERTLYLEGVIASESWFDDDVTPQIFKEELNSGDGDIKIWINSPGGDVIAAAQIYNMLKEYNGKVTVFVDSLAASAASVIAMSGDEVVISPVGLIMVHNPSTIAFGESKDLRKEAEILDEFKESIINAYEIKTGLSRTKISHLMDCETWLNAHKAVELGFADRISEETNENAADMSEMFSAVAVTRHAAAISLLSKIKQRKAIDDSTENNQKVKKSSSVVEAKTLFNRLNLLKSWR